VLVASSFIIFPPHYGRANFLPELVLRQPTNDTNKKRACASLFVQFDFSNFTGSSNERACNKSVVITVEAQAKDTLASQDD
jgi:hypothetical protein